mmetsp:Transcript_6778/g.10695  ORF Transcript_6778/g.10695 Transcript_6778/m.10695 type:complete len:241 (+) Transcript_6778:251-973(+)
MNRLSGWCSQIKVLESLSAVSVTFLPPVPRPVEMKCCCFRPSDLLAYVLEQPESLEAWLPWAHFGTGKLRPRTPRAGLPHPPCCTLPKMLFQTLPESSFSPLVQRNGQHCLNRPSSPQCREDWSCSQRKSQIPARVLPFELRYNLDPNRTLWHSTQKTVPCESFWLQLKSSGCVSIDLGSYSNKDTLSLFSLPQPFKASTLEWNRISFGVPSTPVIQIGSSEMFLAKQFSSDLSAAWPRR